jgi:hypothetical protein
MAILKINSNLFGDLKLFQRTPNIWGSLSFCQITKGEISSILKKI